MTYMVLIGLEGFCKLFQYYFRGDRIIHLIQLLGRLWLSGGYSTLDEEE